MLGDEWVSEWVSEWVIVSNEKKISDLDPILNDVSQYFLSFLFEVS